MLLGKRVGLGESLERFTRCLQVNLHLLEEHGSNFPRDQSPDGCIAVIFIITFDLHGSTFQALHLVAQKWRPADIAEYQK